MHNFELINKADFEAFLNKLESPSIQDKNQLVFKAFKIAINADVLSEINKILVDDDTEENNVAKKIIWVFWEKTEKLDFKLNSEEANNFLSNYFNNAA